MYINCISCGHKFDIGKSYDDYEGPVRCPTCRALLDIRTQDGAIRGVRLGGLMPQAAAPAPQLVPQLPPQMAAQFGPQTTVPYAAASSPQPLAAGAVRYAEPAAGPGPIQSVPSQPEPVQSGPLASAQASAGQAVEPAGEFTIAPSPLGGASPAGATATPATPAAPGSYPIGPSLGPGRVAA